MAVKKVNLKQQFGLLKKPIKDVNDLSFDTNGHGQAVNQCQIWGCALMGL